MEGGVYWGFYGSCSYYKIDATGKVYRISELVHCSLGDGQTESDAYEPIVQLTTMKGKFIMLQ